MTLLRSSSGLALGEIGDHRLVPRGVSLSPGARSGVALSTASRVSAVEPLDDLLGLQLLDEQLDARVCLHEGIEEQGQHGGSERSG